MQVIARVTGGLGNQMFQYAAAFAAARTAGAQLALDTSCCDYTPAANRRYMLDCFAVTGRVITPHRLSRFLYKMAGSERFPRIAALTRLKLNLTDVKETQEYHFAPVLLPVAHRIRLLGYWQSYRYFEAHAAEIRQQFMLRSPATGHNAHLLEQIRSTPGAVSVHIRRGDYLKVRPQAILPLEYYQSAVQIIAQKIPLPTFFLFSDDLAWVRQNLHLPGQIVAVDGNDELSGHEDLRLMSACRHHIIANSSFSWWGAWLNPAREKMVIAPRLWLGTPDSHFPDLYPAGWRTILPGIV